MLFFKEKKGVKMKNIFKLLCRNSKVLLSGIIISSTVSHAAVGDSLQFIVNAFTKIKSADNVVIYIDPTTVNSFSDSADIVLITHEHSDHNEINRLKLKKNCTIIRAADALSGGVYRNFTINGIQIQAFPAYNSYHQKNLSVGYIITFNGIKIYHSGDTGLIQEMSQLKDSSITYALLPMDGTYTMTPAEAVIASERIGAAHYIPMHTSPPSGYNQTRIDQFNIENKLVLKNGDSIELNSENTSVEPGKSNPHSYRIEQNYPNPFNPVTTIEFSLPKESDVMLKVYNLLGQELTTLIDSQLKAGYHKVKFDASGLASGIYLYMIKAGDFSAVKKLILLK